MDISEIKKELKLVLTTSRYEHSVRVFEVARKLQTQFPKVAPDKVALASLFHDYAKCFSKEDLAAYIKAYQLPSSLLTYHHELWHGPVASKLIEDKFNIYDKDVQSAIYYHTTGRAQMTALDYIVFVADYIEPKRDFEAVHKVRELAQTNVVQAFHFAIKNSIHYLMDKDLVVHPDSFQAYNNSCYKIN